jgi:hypothetical protein
MVKKIPREQIQLSKNLDVLVHLPRSHQLQEERFCVAHALQYNVSATGRSPEEALEKLVNLVSEHCIEAISLGINPISIAAQYYWAAFAMGTRMNDAFADVHARVSMELTRCLDRPNVDVRSISAEQEKRGIFDIEEFVRAAAAV